MSDETDIQDEPTLDGENQDKNDATDFLAALAKTTGDKPYLGDQQAVDSIIRGFIEEYRLIAFEGADPLDAEKVDALAAQFADIFLGKNPDYTPLEGWNAVGAIDKHINLAMEWAPDGGASGEDQARAALQGACIHLFDDFNTAVEMAADGKPDSVWQDRLESDIWFWRNILLGVPLPDNQEVDDEEPAAPAADQPGA